MSISRTLALFLCVSAAFAAESSVISFDFTGEVQADADKIENLVTGVQNVPLAWVCPNGSRVAAGDRLAVFDVEVAARNLPMAKADLAIAEQNLLLQSQKLDAQLETQLESLRQLESDLKVCQAAIASMERPDDAALTTLKANYDLAAQQLANAMRDHERVRALHDLGQEARINLDKAAVAVELARLDAETARADWQQELAKTNPTALQNLRLKEAQLSVQLGADDKSGLRGQIETMRKQQRRQRAADGIERDRVARAYHNALRDILDHTPVQYIHIVSADGTVSRKFRFQPASMPPPTDRTADTGRVYDEQRGYGWLADASGCMTAAESEKGFSSCALVQKQQTWRIDLDNGLYEIDIGFGDAVDWSGAIARWRSGSQDGLVFVARSIPARSFPVARLSLTVSDRRLEFVFGDTCDKALRAERDSIALPLNGVEPGWKSRWNAQPMMALVDRKHLTVHARVHQELTPFLRAAGDGETTSTKGGSPRDRLWTNAVRIETTSGAALPGSVSSIVEQPIALSRSPDEPEALDRIAHKVIVSVPEDQAPKLNLGETVTCRCDIPLPAGATALPAHLVANVNNVCSVQVRGQSDLIEVKAVRVGNTFVVLDPLPAGAAFDPPSLASGSASEQASYPGQVVAGQRTPISFPGWSWGRIKNMVPDGSYVTKGQVVVSLYNPGLDQQKDNLEGEKKKANQMYLMSNETRTLTKIQRAGENQASILDEKVKRVALDDAMATDAAWLTGQENESRKAELVAAGKKSVLAEAEALKSSDRSRFEVAAGDARNAEIAARAKLLSFIAACRKLDWIAMRGSAESWSDALETLDLHEQAVRMAQREQEIQSQSAKVKLDQAMEGNQREKNFNQWKDLKAPADGRLFYLTAWDEQMNMMTKFKKDMPVWRGVTIAEVLDVSHLSFQVELPESRFQDIKQGQKVAVVFPEFNNRKLGGVVAATGRSFYAPNDAQNQTAGEQAVAVNRVFEVTIDLETPAELRDSLVPGSKGQLLMDGKP